MENKKDKIDIENIDDKSLNEKKISERFIEYQKYYLIIENSVYKIIIGKRKSEILIKSKKYEIALTCNDFYLLIKKDFKTIDELYDFILNLFEENRVIIKKIKINESMKLILRININTEERIIELLLNLEAYENNDANKMEIINNNSKNKEEILKLNDEIKLLKNEIETIE